MKLRPINLVGKRVRLTPLTQAHHAALCRVGLDPELWQNTTIRVRTHDDMSRYIERALASQGEGTALPFAIIDSASNRVVGTTRFHNLEPAHRRIEIGFTWVAPPWQRTGVNREAKYLILEHAFETLDILRVEFRADADNEQSRHALAGIGATEELTLRSFMTSDHRGMRDIVVHSIIRTEWPAVKAKLQEQLERQRGAAR